MVEVGRMATLQGIKIYSRGRRGAEIQVKCGILIPDRDDRSVHETWAANISTHIIIKEKIR